MAAVEPAAPTDSGKLLGWCVVPKELVQDILDRDGYIAKRRGKVPFSRTEEEGLRAVRRYHTEQRDWTALQIWDVHSELSALVEEKDGKCYIKVRHLDKKYLKSGAITLRQASDFATAPCPVCGEPLTEEDIAQRKQVGVVSFRDDVRLCSPCPREDCLEKQRQRQSRLKTGPVRVVYHATLTENAEKIWPGCSKLGEVDLEAAGGAGAAFRGTILRGANGAAGGGIYGAHTAREVEWKVSNKTPELIVLKLRMRMGEELQLGRTALAPDGNAITFAALQLQYDRPYDSVILNRAAGRTDLAPGVDLGYPVPPPPVVGTRCEELDDPKDKSRYHPGYEFIVYSWDQVEVIGIVKRDRIPQM